MRSAFGGLHRLRLLLDLYQRRPGFWALVLGLALAAAVGASLSRGAVEVPLGDLPAALRDPDHPFHAVVWEVRLPRILAGCAAGAALAVAGALLQTVVRNPLADPGLTGVTAGAGLAALIAIILFPESTLLLPFLAAAGGLAAVGVVLAASWGGGSTGGPLRLILSGVAVQAVLFSGVALMTFLFADRAPAFVSFTVGSLNGAGWREVRIAWIPTLLGISLSLLSLRSLDLLLLDDQSAGGIGLAVRTGRIAASCLSALLAASAVSVAGLVGFVGLVVPNWVRLAVGPTHARLVPLCALGGATLLVLADWAARTLAAPLELPVGALLALVGGPYFLYLLWRKLP